MGARRLSQRISTIQQGLIVEYDFAKFLMMGTGGRIELARPMTDDERRDYEIHIRGQYGLGLACQAKSTMSLPRISGSQTRYLRIYFDVTADRLVNSPYFWYFLAYLDSKAMGLADPVFLVPSEDFHRLAAPVLRDGVWRFSMSASMAPGSRDQWRRYRVGTLELGQRVMEISKGLKKQGIAFPQELLTRPDVLKVKGRSR